MTVKSSISLTDEQRGLHARKMGTKNSGGTDAGGRLQAGARAAINTMRSSAQARRNDRQRFLFLSSQAGMGEMLYGLRTPRDAEDVYGIVLDLDAESVDLIATEKRRALLEARQ